MFQETPPESQILKTVPTGNFPRIFGMCNHLVFTHYPITCNFRKIINLGSTEPARIVGGELFGSVTDKVTFCLSFCSIFSPDVVEISNQYSKNENCNGKEQDFFEIRS